MNCLQNVFDFLYQLWYTCNNYILTQSMCILFILATPYRRFFMYSRVAGYLGLSAITCSIILSGEKLWVAFVFAAISFFAVSFWNE